MFYSKKDYKFVKFEKSHIKIKKYNAVIQNKKTGREVRIPFGARGYEHYKDSTDLKLYSSKDHGDPKRRKNYRARHIHDDIKNYSPGFFAWYYLW